MWYLIIQIIICLLVALIFGFLIGWILRSLSKKDSERSFDHISDQCPQECLDKIKNLEDRLMKELKTNKTQIKELEPKIDAADIVSEQPQEIDDLKRISGIGPVLSVILNEQGIFSFRQIAEFDEVKINEISKKIGAFQDRIRRERWVEKAKAEYTKKYGKQL